MSDQGSVRAPGGTSPGRSGALRIPAILALLLAVWLAISMFFLRYPLTADGRDALLRDRGLALALGLLAVAWYRSWPRSRWYLLAYAVLAALLFVESFLVGYGPGASLTAPWWNEKATGGLMLLTFAAGWLNVRRERQL